MSNKQNATSFIWAAAMLGLLLFFGFFFHVIEIGWFIGVGIYLVGLIWQIKQYHDDNETLAPNAVMFAAAAAIGIIGASA